MSNTLSKIKKLSIREAGFDEYWLQTQIFENPELLDLGENLMPIQREKRQSSGGKLDILMQDPDDNNSLYEIEIMLGETDPSHIIRTLEYWDIERKRYPQRQHYAVLIAEKVTRRFYNVIQLLSINFPLIAIQAELLQIGETQALNFVKVLEVYEEPGLDLNQEIVGEDYWKKYSSWTLNLAQMLIPGIQEISSDAKLNFVKSYISIYANGAYNIFINKRVTPNARLEFYVNDPLKIEKLGKLFDSKNINSDYNKKYEYFWFNIDEDFLIQNMNVFMEAYQISIEDTKEDDLL